MELARSLCPGTAAPLSSPDSPAMQVVVVDIQGVKRGSHYTWTDPQIHSREGIEKVPAAPDNVSAAILMAAAC